MPVHDNLGMRMKENYENRAKTCLVRRMPVAIRVDGKAFHTFTRGFVKPFDMVLVHSMQQTMKHLCENIQGAVFGYTQSDEITLILQDYKELTTDAWFNYEVQKMCSITASMATMAFNRFFAENTKKYWCAMDSNEEGYFSSEQVKQFETYQKAIEKGAMFDARCFNIPIEEVCNLVYWRQLDATRNSIQMVGQANFSHHELQGKSCNQIQEMLHEQKSINWNDYPTCLKRGTACIRPPAEDDSGKFGPWTICYEMPILTGENRSFVESRVVF